MKNYATYSTYPQSKSPQEEMASRSTYLTIFTRYECTTYLSVRAPQAPSPSTPTRDTLPHITHTIRAHTSPRRTTRTPGGESRVRGKGVRNEDLHNLRWSAAILLAVGSIVLVHLNLLSVKKYKYSHVVVDGTFCRHLLPTLCSLNCSFPIT